VIRSLSGYGPARIAGKAFGLLADLVWPPRSLLSDAIVDAPGHIEPDLWRTLAFLTPPWCARCGLPFETPEPEGTVCPACAAAPPVYDCARAALAYDDSARRLVLDLKRAGRRDGLSAFSAWMRHAAGPLLLEADLVVPVPLHWTRLAQRSFNQSVWLAAALARPVGKPVALGVLIRRRRRKSQAGLTPTQRRANVAGTYAVPAGRRANVRGRTILLVDDVATTGATLDACARVLRRAGAARVDAVTLARVVRPAEVAI